MNPAEDVALGTIAEEAVEQLGGLLAASGTRVQVLPGLPVVRGDRLRLLEVFQNLIENAVKFSAGAADPLVEIGARGEGEGRAVFVRDNGQGVDPQYHERIFGLAHRGEGGGDASRDL